MRNSDVELQQRSIEYLHLSSLATADVLVSKDLLQWVRLRYPSHQRAVKGLESLCLPAFTAYIHDNYVSPLHHKNCVRSIT